MFSIDDIERASAELRRLLEREVAASPAEAILLSGGLDTSILALLYSRAQPQKPLRAITVCLEENSISEPDLRKVAEEWGIEAGLLPSPDKYFACSLARLLGLEHRVISVTARQLLDLMPEVIAHLETFDPMELRNSVVVYCGLRAAAPFNPAHRLGDQVVEAAVRHGLMTRSEAMERTSCSLATAICTSSAKRSYPATSTTSQG